VAKISDAGELRPRRTFSWKQNSKIENKVARPTRELKTGSTSRQRESVNWRREILGEQTNKEKSTQDLATHEQRRTNPDSDSQNSEPKTDLASSPSRGTKTRLRKQGNLLTTCSTMEAESQQSNENKNQILRTENQLRPKRATKKSSDLGLGTAQQKANKFIHRNSTRLQRSTEVTVLTLSFNYWIRNLVHDSFLL
jgi:hypothetical protein